MLAVTAGEWEALETEYGRCLLKVDIVAKRFFTSRCATLIQEMDPPRKIDSNDALIGFESCSLGGERRLLQQYLP
jgi:hypothetical protein